MSISWIAPSECSCATRSGSTSIGRTVPSRMRGVGQLVRFSDAAPRRRSQRPRSRAELAQMVVDGPGPVRVAGAGHSFSAAAVTDGTLLSLDALARVLDADAVERAACASRPASACTRSRASCTRAGWRCRTSATSTSSRSPARSRPARTAPAPRLPNLSGQVESVELVLADGSERTVTGGDELRAARVSLGALGVVAAVTLRCVPAFRLHNVDRPEPLEDVLDGLQERADAHDHFEFWTFPHSDIALTRTHDRTDAPPSTPGRTRAYVERRADGQPRLPRDQRARAPLPGTIPRLNRFASQRRLAARARRLVLRDLRLRAARALRGDGVQRPARAGRRRRARRPRDARAPPGLVPGRAALHAPATTRCSRPPTAATAPSSPCTSSSGMEYEPAVPRGRGRAVGARRAPALGQALVPLRRRAGSALPALGRLPGRCARELDPGGRFASAWVRHVLG